MFRVRKQWVTSVFQQLLTKLFGHSRRVKGMVRMFVRGSGVFERVQQKFSALEAPKGGMEFCAEGAKIRGGYKKEIPKRNIPIISAPEAPKRRG